MKFIANYTCFIAYTGYMCCAVFHNGPCTTSGGDVVIYWSINAAGYEKQCIIFIQNEKIQSYEKL